MLGLTTVAKKIRALKNWLRVALHMKVGSIEMNWIGKVRPQVLTAIILLGSMGLYSIYNGGYEAATGFGALVGMLAKEVIASDD